MEAEVEKEVLTLLEELTDLCGTIVQNQRKMLTLQTMIHDQIINLTLEEIGEEGELYGNC